MKVIELQIKSNGEDSKPLKAVATVEFDNGFIIKDFKVLQMNPKDRPFVVGPEAGWLDPATRELKRHSILTMPPHIKREVFALVLAEWIKARENNHGAIK